MQTNFGLVGFRLHFTTKIPVDASVALAGRSVDPLASFDLTPDLGTVPELRVIDLVDAGVKTPDHWGIGDVVVPIINGQAFYVGNIGLGQHAMSVSMMGVNLRTGRAESPSLTDDPCQSYWAPGVDIPWIDGYVPSDGQAVRQFVPLMGEEAMMSDVARHVGIPEDDPFINALRARFFAPLRRREETTGHHKPIISDWWSGGGDPVFRGSRSPQLMGAPLGSQTKQARTIGMGAGGRMRQRHEHNNRYEAGDFESRPWTEMVMRLVWLDEWNQLAGFIHRELIGSSQLDILTRRQTEYEQTLRRRLGIAQRVDTDVDALPSPTS